MGRCGIRQRSKRLGSVNEVVRAVRIQNKNLCLNQIFRLGRDFYLFDDFHLKAFSINLAPVF